MYFSAFCISLHWHFPRLSVPGLVIALSLLDFFFVTMSYFPFGLYHKYFPIWIVSQIFYHLDCITNIFSFGLHHKYFPVWIVSQIFYHFDCITNILPNGLYRKYFPVWIVSQIFSHLDCITIKHISPLNFNFNSVFQLCNRH